MQSDAAINTALGVLSWCSAQLQRRVEELIRDPDAIPACHSAIYDSHNSCQWLQNHCRWDLLYSVSALLQHTSSAAEQRRSWVTSNNSLHSEVFILITTKKASYQFQADGCHFIPLTEQKQLKEYFDVSRYSHAHTLKTERQAIHH